MSSKKVSTFVERVTALVTMTIKPLTDKFIENWKSRHEFDFPAIDHAEKLASDIARKAFYDKESKGFQSKAKALLDGVVSFENFGTLLGDLYGSDKLLVALSESGASISIPAGIGFAKSAATIPMKVAGTRKNKEGEYEYFSAKVSKQSAKISDIASESQDYTLVASVNFDFQDSSKIYQKICRNLRRATDYVKSGKLDEAYTCLSLIEAQTNASPTDLLNTVQAVIYSDISGTYKQLSKAITVDETTGLAKTPQQLHSAKAA